MRKYIVFAAIALALIASPALALDDVFFKLGTLYHNTTRVLTTDTNALFTTAYDTARGATSDWTKIKGAFITCAGNSALLAFGVAAENDATSVGHELAAGQSAFITEASWIQTMRIISKTAGSAAALQVTLVY